MSAAARVLNAVSMDEMRRRWRAVRARMDAQGVDALVLQNSSDWVGGYVRWFSNQPATNGYPTSVVFPARRRTYHHRARPLRWRAPRRR